MDYEELEYFEHRLEEALNSGCFYPAEICERRHKNNYTTLYNSEVNLIMSLHKYTNHSL